MKTLLAITCVAVLVAIGYFFYGEYAEADALKIARAELHELAEAEEWDDTKVRSFCASMNRDTPLKKLQRTQHHLANCRALGYL